MKECEAVEFQWPFISSLVASPAIVSESALRTGALTRRREIKSADDLLRLVMTYALCGFSLRQTAAFAQAHGFAEVSDVALLKRFKHCDVWLGELLSRKLAERAGAVPEAPFRIRVVDATTVNRPGTHGTDWRLHVAMNLRLGQIDHIELTDAKGGESLHRFRFEPGDVVIADRGYAHRGGLEVVSKAGARFIVRTNWQNLPLESIEGKPLDILSALRSIGEATVEEFDVQFRSPAGKAIRARLVATRRSEPAAARTRKEAMYESRKKGRVVDPRTLESAGFFYVLTNVPREEATAAQILELYRFRWQIEMNFKDLKGVLDLNGIPAKDPAVARTWLYAKLLGAFLIDDLTSRFVSFSPWGYKIQPSATFDLATAPHSS